MPNRVPWTERTFSFDFPVDLHPELMERLRGTPRGVRAIRDAPSSRQTHARRRHVRSFMPSMTITIWPASKP